MSRVPCWGERGKDRGKQDEGVLPETQNCGQNQDSDCDQDKNKDRGQGETKVSFSHQRKGTDSVFWLHLKQTLSGRIFIDTNLNGRYDAGVDIPRGNWPVIIVLVNSTKARLAARAPPGLTKLAETTTNSDGTWTATYTSPPPGSVLGITDDSTLQSDVMDKITVPAGGQVPGNTFGSSPTNASCSGAADCPAATGGCSTPACNSGICSYTFTSCSVTPSSTVGGGVTTKKVVSSSVAPALPSSTVVAALTTKFTTAVPLVPSSTADSKSSTRLPTTTISIAASTTAEAMVSTTQQLAAGTTSDTATTTALESSTSQTATATPTPTTSSLSQTTSSATETTSTPAPCPWNFDSTVPAGYIINIAGANTFGAGGQATSVLLESPRGIAVDSQNNTFVADRDRIWKIYPNGSTVVYAGVINIGYISRYGGDGGPATSAKLSAPTGLAFTPDGDLLVADSGNNRIRIIYQSNGTIDTVAGNGGSDGDGDDGPAVNATIARPLGVAMTSAGVMYIAAANNYAVRKVSAAGIITTFAGQNGNSGADSGDNGAATDATFDTPAGVAVDSSGRVFISDMYGTSVRMVATNGIISSPSSQPSWSYLSLLSTDNTGKILIADQGIQQVYRFTPPNSGFTLVAGDGGSGFVDNCDAVNAQLKNPSNAVTDSVGQIYITDSGNRRIRKIDTSGTISTFAGTGFSYYAGDGGPATSAEVGTQQAGITMHSATKELYFADTQANTIRKIAVDGIISTVVGTTDYAFAGDSGPATSASLKGPYDVVFGPDGRMFIADTSNARIRAVSTGGTISTFAGNGAYAYSGDGGPATSASFKYPIALAIDSAGNLFVAEQLGNVIRKIDTNGIISTAAGNGTSGKGPMGVQANRTMFQSPGGVEVNPAGTMLYFT